MNILSAIMFCRKSTLKRIIAIFLVAVCLVGSLSRTTKAESYTSADSATTFPRLSSDLKKNFSLSAVDRTSADTDKAPHPQRSQNIIVYSGTKILHVTCYGEPLQEVLERIGITVDETVVVSVPADTLTYNGMQVRVDRLGEGTERYTVEIPFETVYCEDPSLPLGQEKVMVYGKPGQMLCTANVTYVNGMEDVRTVLEQTVTAEPVKQIVAVGTGKNVGSDAPIIGDGFIILPTGEVLTYTHTDQFVATAYTQYDEGCDEFTANGARVKWGVVAVDPSLIPYGTRMFIVSNDGEYIYGLSTAEDCGSSIKNKRLDLYMPTLSEAFQFGIRDCTVYFLGDADWRDNI